MKLNFADRMGDVKPSATFKYSAMAKKPGVINLTIGRPDYDTPKIIKEACKKAIDDGKVHYTPAAGIPELREKIAEKLSTENKIPGLNADKIIVSGGAKMILYEAFTALVGPGDKVAIPDPSWVSYEAMIKLAQAEVVWLPTSPEEGFKPGEEFLGALEASGANVLVINSPSNPTGAVYDEKILRKITDICEREGIFLISDEPYEKFIYEGKHASPGSWYEDTLTVNAFSKSFAMTGWRIGYGGCPNPDVIAKLKTIQGQSLSNATTFAQWGSLACFTPEAEAAAKSMVADFKERRDHVMKLVNKLPCVCKKPEGAFYVFPKFKGADDEELAGKLLDAGVGTIPGSAFGPRGAECIRISYGSGNKETLNEAFNRIEGVVG
ncbi:MAG: pyridoxal phosphate-dependent aminotransferase [Candidatus Altiarchaeota archaeon]